MGFDNPIHIIFLLIVLLLVFGAKRLPEMGRSLGEGMRGFKDSISGEGGSAHTSLSAVTPEQPAQPAQPVQVHPLASEPVVSAEEQVHASTPRAA
jgi:sec-independent protein translocase protein TatA